MTNLRLTTLLCSVALLIRPTNAQAADQTPPASTSTGTTTAPPAGTSATQAAQAPGSGGAQIGPPLEAKTTGPKADVPKQESVKVVVIKQEAPKAPDARSAILMRYGVTVGVGLAAHLPNSSKIKAAAASVMGYVAIFPVWWGLRGDVNRYFCAARFRGEDDAKRAADEYAKELTIAYRKSRKLPAIEDLEGGIDPDLLTEEAKAAVQIATGSDPEKNVADGWKLHPDLIGTCYAKGIIPDWLGVFAGLAAPFKTNSAIDGSDKIKEFTPVVSFGAIAAPRSYFSIFAGGMYVRIAASTGVVGSTDTISRGIVVPTVGIGLNGDVFGQLFK